MVNPLGVARDQGNFARDSIKKTCGDAFNDFNTSQAFVEYLPTTDVITCTPVGSLTLDENNSSQWKLKEISYPGRLYTIQTIKLALGTMISNIISDELQDINNGKLLIKKGLACNILQNIYFNDDPTLFINNIPNDTIPSNGFSTTISLNTIQDFNTTVTNRGNPFSVQWFGYIIINGTDIGGSDYIDITFTITSDDASYLWIRNKALHDYTIDNADIKNGGLHGMRGYGTTTRLYANTITPIRILFGQNYGGADFYLTMKSSTGTDMSSYLYTITTSDNKLYKQKQLYFALVENSSQNTAKKLFNCYITDPNDTTTTTQIQLIDRTNSTTMTNNVEYETIWKSDGVGSYALLGPLGFCLYNSTNALIKCISPLNNISNEHRLQLTSNSDGSTVTLMIYRTQSNTTTLVTSLFSSTAYTDNIACKNWYNDKTKNNRSSILTSNNRIDQNNYLISSDYKYKLKMTTQGQLVIQRAKKIPSNTVVDSNNITFTYSLSNSTSRFMYNIRSDYRMNKMIYITNKDKKHRIVPNDSRFLVSTASNSYSQFTNIAPTSGDNSILQDTNTSISSITSTCQSNCNKNDSCGGVYVYQTNNGKKWCNFVSNQTYITIPSMFNDIQGLTGPTDISSSNLYIKDKRIKLTSNKTDYYVSSSKAVSGTDYNNLYPSTSYNLGMIQSDTPAGIDVSQPFKLCQQKLQTLVGSFDNFQGYRQNTEGFTYNTNDCGDAGCYNFIKTQKINPLIQSAANYSNTLNALKNQSTDFSNNVTQFYSIRDDLSNNKLSHYSHAELSDSNFNNNNKKSILEAANDDLNELIIQQNNMYIIGTITTATLLVTAILLSSV